MCGCRRRSGGLREVDVSVGGESVRTAGHEPNAKEGWDATAPRLALVAHRRAEVRAQLRVITIVGLQHSAACETVIDRFSTREG